jgi:hypothetical protein
MVEVNEGIRRPKVAAKLFARHHLPWIFEEVKEDA